MLTLELLEQNSMKLALGLVFSEVPEGWSFDDVVSHLYDTELDPEIDGEGPHGNLIVCETYQYLDARAIIDELHSLQTCIYYQFEEFCITSIAQNPQLLEAVKLLRRVHNTFVTLGGDYRNTSLAQECNEFLRDK